MISTASSAVCGGREPMAAARHGLRQQNRCARLVMRARVVQRSRFGGEQERPSACRRGHWKLAEGDRGGGDWLGEQVRKQSRKSNAWLGCGCAECRT